MQQPANSQFSQRVALGYVARGNHLAAQNDEPELVRFTCDKHLTRHYTRCAREARSGRWAPAPFWTLINAAEALLRSALRTHARRRAS